MVSFNKTFIIPESPSRGGFPAVLTAEKAAFVEELAVTLHFLGVVNGPLARSALVAPSPVWHCCFSKDRQENGITPDSSLQTDHRHHAGLLLDIKPLIYFLREYVDHSFRIIRSEYCRFLLILKILGHHFKLLNQCFELFGHCCQLLIVVPIYICNNAVVFQNYRVWDFIAYRLKRSCTLVGMVLIERLKVLTRDQNRVFRSKEDHVTEHDWPHPFPFSICFRAHQFRLEELQLCVLESSSVHQSSLSGCSLQISCKSLNSPLHFRNQSDFIWCHSQIPAYISTSTMLT